jgi:hypothetical protein
VMGTVTHALANPREAMQVWARGGAEARGCARWWARQLSAEGPSCSSAAGLWGGIVCTAHSAGLARPRVHTWQPRDALTSGHPRPTSPVLLLVLLPHTLTGGCGPPRRS